MKNYPVCNELWNDFAAFFIFKNESVKFYLKHHWGGGKALLSFGADQIRTLVSMATDSSHRIIMGKTASLRFLDCF